MSILNRYNGFEELELGGGVNEQITDAVEDAVRAEVAEVQVELEQVSQEIEEIRADVAETDEAVEEVQELVEGLESMIGSGTFHSGTFATIYNRAAKLNTKLGGQSIERCGAEALSDAASAQVMARAGMEGFMETVKGWGKKAIEAIKHIFNAVINFFVGLFSAADKLSRRHDQLATKLAATEKVKEKVKLGGWNVLFDYSKNGLNKDPDNWTATTNAIAGFANVAKDVSKIELGQFNSAYATLASAIKADAKKDGAAEKGEGDKRTLIGVNAGVRVHAELKDGTAKDLKEAAEYARSVKLHFGTGGDKALTTGEVAPKADKTMLGTKLASVKKAITGIRGDKGAAAFSKAQRDKVIASLSVLKADDKEKQEHVNEQIALVRAVFTSASSATQAVGKQVIRNVGWTLDAVSAHL